jgi:hypothetical protein
LEKCNLLIIGYKDAKYKKFNNISDDIQYIDNNTSSIFFEDVLSSSKNIEIDKKQLKLFLMKII